ncbi:MAG: immunoglobulin domain-containing protein [Opitutaceae bacterium]
MRLPPRSKFPRLNVPAAGLLLLLQRTPVVRVATEVVEVAGGSRIVSLLKSAVATLGSLGAVHTLAGATRFTLSSPSVIATVGTPIFPFAFSVTGAAVPAGSYRLSGTLPPGLSIAGLDVNGVINATTGVISGTPAGAGTFTISILAYERTNGTGDSFGPATVVFVVSAPAADAPTITVQPAGQTATLGTAVTLGVAATGSPVPTFQWRRDDTPIAGATATTLTFASVRTTEAGSYTVVVTNSAGSVTSATAILAVSVVSAAPAITAQPQSQFVAPGTPVTFSVAASGGGLAYQWKKDGSPIGGATQASLALAGASANSAGFYSVVVTNAADRIESAVATLTLNEGGESRLINVSTRGFVPIGGSLTPGFVLRGNATKTLVIRAIGPTLGSFGVSGTLDDPMMEVIPLGGTLAVATNDNWGGAVVLQSAFARVGAFPLAVATSTDASVETSLVAAGASGYTVRITSKNPAVSGIALAEVYDEDPTSAPVRLVNVSTMGFVGTGQQALVPGFVIGGSAPKLLLIRAIGPGLAQFGVGGLLADPQLSVAPLGQDLTVARNDNWGTALDLVAAFTQAGAFALPSDSRDAAVVVRLPPGGYTVVVSGVGNTTGTALVEIYDLDP